MSLLRWTLFPGCFPHPCEPGDPGPGSGSGGNQEADEARKQALRDKIDAMFGIGKQIPIYDSDPATPGTHKEYRNTAGQDEPENFQYVDVPDGNGPVSARQILGYQEDPVAVGARKQMQDEDAQLSDATRSYYSDQLDRSFAAAERANRFRLARQGLMGGSEDVDSNTNLETDRTLGATRIDDAARAAAAGLDAARENERLNSINLVNAGAGESAVNSASAGLRNALNTANSQQKANLFGDLFASGAYAYSNAAAQQAAAGMLAQYQKSLASYFPVPATSGGRVTPSG